MHPDRQWVPFGYIHRPFGYLQIQNIELGGTQQGELQTVHDLPDRNSDKSGWVSQDNVAYRGDTYRKR